jgi:Zn-dependent protease
MNSSWKLGNAFGIGVYVHWTFAILPALAFYSGWNAGGMSQGLFSLAVLFAMCACVVLHELGHALMARWFQIATRDITLYPIGGVARLERLTTRPAEELLIAVAGPLVNVIITALLGVIWVGVVSSLGQTATVSMFIMVLLFGNIFLALFNMLPAFPMDGGRVLRALLALAMDYVRATEIAFYAGVSMACVFAAATVLFTSWKLMQGTVPLPMLGVIAVFIVLAGRQELNMVRHRAARLRAEPIDALPADEDALPPQGAVAPDFSGYTWDHRLQALVKWHNGRPVGSYTVPTE